MRRRVARDVAERPDGLAAHVGVRRAQQLAEDRHRARVDHGARLLGRARQDVRQRPRRLELERRRAVAREERDEARDNARVDDLLDRPVSLAAELAEPRRRLGVHARVGVVHGLNEA